MRYITVFLLLTLICLAAHSQQTGNYKPKTIDICDYWGKLKVDSSLSFGNYEFMIGTRGKSCAAYKMYDSAWVIIDTADAVRILLWYAQEKLRPNSNSGNNRLSNK